MERKHNISGEIDFDAELDANMMQKSTPWLVLAIVCGSVLLVILLLLLVLRKRIVIAIALVKEGSK